MNSLIAVLAVIGCVAAQGRYRPQAVSSGPGGPHIAILKQSNDVNPDGSYQWSYETENGIAAQEQGSVKNVNAQDSVLEAQGSFQYTAPDGTPVSIQYVAGEGGFQAQGSHIPQAPPIPEAILRSIAWNEAHPEEEDGRAAPPRRF